MEKMIYELCSTLWVQLIIMGIFYILTFVMVLIDLRAGIRKAKRAGSFSNSYRMTQTIDKLNKRFNMLLLMSVADMVQMVGFWHLNNQADSTIPIFPVLTFFGSCLVAVIEGKSIFEKKDKKEKARVEDAVSTIAKLLKNKDLNDKIDGFLKNKNTQKEDNGTDAL